MAVGKQTIIQCGRRQPVWLSESGSAPIESESGSALIESEPVSFAMPFCDRRPCCLPRLQRNFQTRGIGSQGRDKPYNGPLMFAVAATEAHRQVPLDKRLENELVRRLQSRAMPCHGSSLQASNRHQTAGRFFICEEGAGGRGPVMQCLSAHQPLVTDGCVSLCPSRWLTRQ